MDMFADDGFDVVEAQEPLLPLAVAERKRLLEDQSCLQAACHALWKRFARAQSNVISVRVVGRVVADIHRELDLEVPGEHVLNKALQQHALPAAFKLDRDGFHAFLGKVLSQCLQGEPLADDDMPSARSSEADADTEVQACQPCGLIPVTVQKLDGTSAEVIIDDMATVNTLGESVEEKLGVTRCVQKLLFGSEILVNGVPLFKQGVTQGAVITVVACKPQAMLLRIRRVNIGDTSVPKKAESRLHKEIPNTTVSKKHATKAAAAEKRETSKSRRTAVPDVRIRPAFLGRI